MNHFGVVRYLGACRPKKSILPGIKGAQLLKHIDSNLGSDIVREAVQLHPQEDPFEGLALNNCYYMACRSLYMGHCSPSQYMPHTSSTRVPSYSEALSTDFANACRPGKAITPERWKCFRDKSLFIGNKKLLSSKSVAPERWKCFQGKSLFIGDQKFFSSDSAACVEQESVTSSQASPDNQQDAALALEEFLEQIDGMQKDLAHNIARNSPMYLEKVTHSVKSGQSSEFKNFGAEVKEYLLKSKAKGIEPYFESLGFTEPEIEKVIPYARCGLCGPNSVSAKVNFLLGLGVLREEVPKVMVSNPRTLSNALETQTLKLKFLSQLGISAAKICQLVTTYPKVLSFTMKDGTHPIIDFLRSFGVPDEDLGKVLGRCPQLLTLSIEYKLKPAVQILETVGITGTRLAKVLVTQPSLLRRRLERNVAFCQSYGLDLKPGVIARLLVTCPSFSVEGCEVRVNYLKSIGLTQEQIITMISRNPAFLSVNVEKSLSPKIDYLVNVMGRSISELITAPTYLTMSLESRIKPRHRVLTALLEKGHLTRSYKLNTIVAWTDSYFVNRFIEHAPSDVKELWG